MVTTIACSPRLAPEVLNQRHVMARQARRRKKEQRTRSAEITVVTALKNRNPGHFLVFPDLCPPLASITPSSRARDIIPPRMRDETRRSREGARDSDVRMGFRRQNIRMHRRTTPDGPATTAATAPKNHGSWMRATRCFGIYSIIYIYTRSCVNCIFVVELASGVRSSARLDVGMLRRLAQPRLRGRGYRRGPSNSGDAGRDPGGEP